MFSIVAFKILAR